MMELTEVRQRIDELRDWYGRGVSIVEALSVATSIAEANPDNERGADARIRIAGYLARLEEMGV